MIEPHRIAGQFFNRPLLLTPQVAKTISSFLLSRFDARRSAGVDTDAGVSSQVFAPTLTEDGKTAEFHSPRASRFYGEFRVGPDGRPTPYRVTSDGTAIIPIIGELVNRGAWVGASSGLVSYEGIKYAVLKAAQDPEISSILMDIESPGGEAVGAFETAAAIRKVAAEKPVLAFVNGMAASAGYAIASAASRIITMPTGTTGSIGVVMMHLDISEYLGLQGIKPTFIFAGEHKIDGNPYEPLPDDVRVYFQAEIDAFYELFVQSVAQGRGSRLTEQQARMTEARCFLGDDAIRLGLADEIGSVDDVMAQLAAPQSGLAFLGQTSAASTRRTITMGNEISDQTSDTIEAEVQEETERTVAASAASTAPTFAEAAPERAAPAIAEYADRAAGDFKASALSAVPTAAAAAKAERERAAGINILAGQAARLGVAFDAGKAINDGTPLEALRASVLNSAADLDAATAVVSTSAAPSRVAGDPSRGGGLVAAAEKRRTDLLAKGR